MSVSVVYIQAKNLWLRNCLPTTELTMRWRFSATTSVLCRLQIQQFDGNPLHYHNFVAWCSVLADASTAGAVQAGRGMAFFATSHGKSVCGGTGGTVKREVARASLQATNGRFILTPADLYQWWQKHISGIKFICVSKDDIHEHGS